MQMQSPKLKERSQRTIDKRAAIQLSMNFLIMLIMAIIVFTFSIMFLKDFFTSATEIKGSLDEQARIDIESMLAGDARVAIPIDKRETKPGKSVVFGVGIKNTLRNANFAVRIVESSQPSQSGTTYYSGSHISYTNTLTHIYCDRTRICWGETIGPKKQVSLIGFSNNGLISLKTNSNGIVSFVVQPKSDAPRGEYIYDLRVCVNETGPVYPNLNQCAIYDNQIHRLHVIVK